MEIRKLFTVLLLWLMAAGAWAQNAIAVYQKDGQVARFAFTEKPVVTYSGNELVMTTSKTSVQYPIYLLQKIGFDVDEIISGIDEEIKHSPMQFAFYNGTLVVSGGEAGSGIAVYTVNGTKVGQYRLDRNGCVSIPLHSIGRNLYIVKAKQFSFKFRKP